jgi:hypothetical protein
MGRAILAISGCGILLAGVILLNSSTQPVKNVTLRTKQQTTTSSEALGLRRLQKHHSDVVDPNSGADISPFTAADPDPSVLVWLPEMTQEEHAALLSGAEPATLTAAAYRPGVTCGFMTSPLSDIADSGEVFPTVKVYMCRHLAPQQPAPALFVHCGGPSTISDCIGRRGTANEELSKHYNIFSKLVLPNTNACVLNVLINRHRPARIGTLKAFVQY